MTNFLTTERLIIRPWIPQEDASQAWQIYGDAEVMKFIRPPVESIKAVKQLLQEKIELYQQRNNGTGFWAVVEKESLEIVGTILLVQLPDNQNIPTNDYEVGWLFRHSSWGKGYAAEAAKAIINYGWQVLKLPEIFAVIKPDNQRSINLAQRLGMKPMGLTNNYYDVELLLFNLLLCTEISNKYSKSADSC